MGKSSASVRSGFGSAMVGAMKAPIRTFSQTDMLGRDCDPAHMDHAPDELSFSVTGG
jgi:hypothetical protein